MFNNAVSVCEENLKTKINERIQGKMEKNSEHSLAIATTFLISPGHALPSQKKLVFKNKNKNAPNVSILFLKKIHFVFFKPIWWCF